MIVDVRKTKGIVFHRPNPQMCIDVILLFRIEQVKEVITLYNISAGLNFNLG